MIVSIGFDEEGGADQSYGARCLAETLMERYGKDGIEMIVCWLSRSIIMDVLTKLQFDEGIAGIENRFGTDFALPATAEKGYIDVTVTVSVPGGHSSTPPDHTASSCLGFHLSEDRSI